MARKKPLVLPPSEAQATQVTRGYKYRIYPNQQQQAYLAKAFGSARFVYNRLLEHTSKAYQDYQSGLSTTKPSISNSTLNAALTSLKQSQGHDWLYEASCTALQESAFNLAKAYKAFFTKKAKYPSFKSKRHKQSVTYTTAAFSITGKSLKLAKLEQPLQLRLSRPLPSSASYCTVSKTPSGKYYVSLLCTFVPTRKAGTGTIGIDAGITDLATFSDGSSIPNPRHYVKLQRKLAHAQRRLSKKQKGSHNRSKQRLKVAKLHERIANQRSDYLHKLSSQLVRDNQAIAIESLQVANMLRNHKLAKHITDAGWASFRSMLAYKVQETTTGYLFLADPYFPSTQLCSSCGTKPTEKLKLGTREWVCSHCGDTHQRDHNAAKNLEKLAKYYLPIVAKTDSAARVHLTTNYGQLH